jgi:hypothetical protein
MEATITREQIRESAARKVGEIREQALEVCREVDPLCDGKLRLAVQAILDSATDAQTAFVEADSEVEAGDRVTWYSTLLREQRVGTVQTVEKGRAIVLPEGATTTLLLPVSELKSVTL